jgi:hypothetical protein
VFAFDEYAQKIPKKFKNVLYTHWEKRLKIYDTEDYPHSTIKINLKDPS